MQHDHDIIIVGGGMVGAALAARVGHAGFSVGWWSTAIPLLPLAVTMTCVFPR